VAAADEAGVAGDADTVVGDRGDAEVGDVAGLRFESVDPQAAKSTAATTSSDARLR
jgi:hypothetical protein